MARTPADRSTTRPSLRDGLAEVSAFVAGTQRADLAAFVDAALAPGGWEQLRATDPSRVEGSHNLAMNIPESIRDQIKAAAAADPAATTLTAKVNEGLAEYLAGRFKMPRWVDRRSVQPEARVNLNVMASKLLSTQATEKIRQETHDRRASSARVAAEYLMFTYKLGRYAPGARVALPQGAERNPEVPRRVRDLIRELSAASGERVHDIVNEGFQKFLDGEFDPQPVVWSAEDAADMVPMRMRPNDALHDRVKEACKGHPVLNAKTGPNVLAIDYLLDQLGIEADRAE
ncbi:hypothetical protein SAM23877_p086 (plasmid) [Streptomyces ambofaciens ATCC 23877]|uniref:Uncharacterized protein n=1 Tax=Streptomyces ambofaciens (strain ATCC 23877 / 3486 / DSM 40053 / JCM 4204 / NBRC 12836 / NRRL B-2516) TaxID=278992 RepID=A0A0K2B5W2_STRA7|nr:hypothetical protein [Streptomyces ambofaciens]AKZ60795.1 hypothetical protein SAM23877_p086 [Streptomyces ambofaciens ATCC 23877]